MITEMSFGVSQRGLNDLLSCLYDGLLSLTLLTRCVFMSLRSLSCNYISGKFWSWGWGPVWDFVHSWWLFKQYCLAQHSVTESTVNLFNCDEIPECDNSSFGIKSLLKWGPTHPTHRVAFLFCFSVSQHSYWYLSQVNISIWKSDLSESS